MSAVSCHARNKLVVSCAVLRFSLTYLVMHLLVKGLESVTSALRLELLVGQHFLELGDHTIKHCRRNLQQTHTHSITTLLRD